MDLKYPMEIIPDEIEGAYTINYPDLPGCVTCCENFEDIEKVAEDARRVWMEAMYKDKMEIPLPESKVRYSGQFKPRIPKSLHKSLARNAKKEGISLNRYCLYLLSMNNASFQKNRII